MNLESLRAHCMSFPHATENIQWGADLVFKIGGKMFCVTCVEKPSAHAMSFKATPENFEQLIENEGVVPAPYLARAKWVALERFDSLPAKELKRLVRESYDMVFATLPKKTQRELSGPPKR